MKLHKIVKRMLALSIGAMMLLGTEAVYAEIVDDDKKESSFEKQSELLEETEEEGEFELPYEDVAKTDWFYDAVYHQYVDQVMIGGPVYRFGPYEPLSRAQIALILYRLEGREDVVTDKQFHDISGEEWYGPAVLWAAEKGIVTGYQNGYFGPADVITREQLATMMYRYAKYLGKDVDEYDINITWFDGKYEDQQSVSPFAEKAMFWAVSNGIITGKADGTVLDPQGETARCEAAVIVFRFETQYLE